MFHHWGKQKRSGERINSRMRVEELKLYHAKPIS